jgi:hypothetical protein
MDFGIARFFVNAALSAFCGGPLEMLHYICDVNVCAINARLDQGLVEKFARRADEGTPDAVFLISGLLSYQHDRCLRHSLAENCLVRSFPKITCFAMTRGAPQAG